MARSVQDLSNIGMQGALVRYNVKMTHGGGTTKIIQEAIAKALEEVGAYWHSTFLPLHFTYEANRKYVAGNIASTHPIPFAGYMLRAGDVREGHSGWKRTYTARKLRKFGHKRPLAYTGEAQKQALGGRRIHTTVQKGMNSGTVLAKVVYSVGMADMGADVQREAVPNSWRRSVRVGGPQKRAELTCVSLDEQKIMGEMLAEKIVNRLTKIFGGK